MKKFRCEYSHRNFFALFSQNKDDKQGNQHFCGGHCAPKPGQTSQQREHNGRGDDNKEAAQKRYGIGWGRACHRGEVGGQNDVEASEETTGEVQFQSFYSRCLQLKVTFTVEYRCDTGGAQEYQGVNEKREA